MTKDSGLLIMFHCEQHTGYAIGVLETVFHEAAVMAGYKKEDIYWSYKKIAEAHDDRVISCDYSDTACHADLVGFLEKRNITQVLAFDLNYPSPVIRALRGAGVKKIISYWGAAISSLNYGIKLRIKRIEWRLRASKPDQFIFESEAMRLTATHGRGIPGGRTQIIPLGVDTDIFAPDYLNDTYAHQALNIPQNRKIIFYSGHMEERKGVRVIVLAAKHLIEVLKRRDAHFVFCGNKGAEADIYEAVIADSEASKYVSFAGYRTDISQLMRSSYVGVIASTGWDSFTMSSVEMMSSGLPLIVSNLQGLSETIEDGVNGYLIKPGEYIDLARKIEFLLESVEKAKEFSRASRSRAVEKFSRTQQVKKLAFFLSASAVRK